MRIGLVCPYSLTIPGGVQLQVLGLAHALRAKGYATRVLAPCDGPPPDAGVTPLGNSLPTSANGSIAPIAPDPACQLRAMRAMRDEAFDVIHLHEPLAPGPTMTALLTRPAPLLGTFHAAGSSLAYDLLPRATSFLASRLDYRTAVSPDARDLAHRAFGGHYDLLFNGVEISDFRSGGGRPKATPLLGPTILFVGRHEPRKGLGVLLEAFGRLPETTRLWVVGEGPETGALRARVGQNDRIEWLGTIPADEKIARIKAATVLCAPSLRGESFGVVLLEAMAAGTAVVASDLAGYRNVATDDLNALLTPPGDPVTLAAALRRVLSDTSVADRLVAAGHERAECFSMDALASQYLKRYELIAGPVSPTGATSSATERTAYDRRRQRPPRSHPAPRGVRPSRRPTRAAGRPSTARAQTPQVESK